MIAPKTLDLMQGLEPKPKQSNEASDAIHFEFVFDKKMRSKVRPSEEKLTSLSLPQPRSFEGINLPVTPEVDARTLEREVELEAVEAVEADHIGDQPIEISTAVITQTDRSDLSWKVVPNQDRIKPVQATDYDANPTQDPQIETEIGAVLVNDLSNAGNSKDAPKGIASQHSNIEFEARMNFEKGNPKRSPSLPQVNGPTQLAPSTKPMDTEQSQGTTSAVGVLSDPILVRVQSRGDILLGVAQPVAAQLIQRPPDGVQRLTLQMQPDGLGQLNIKMQKNNGRLSIKVEAQNDTINRTLSQDVDLLKSALRSLLPDLQQVEIQVSREPNAQSQQLSNNRDDPTNESGADSDTHRGFTHTDDGAIEGENKNVEREDFVTASSVTI